MQLTYEQRKNVLLAMYKRSIRRRTLLKVHTGTRGTGKESFSVGSVLRSGGHGARVCSARIYYTIREL